MHAYTLMYIHQNTHMFIYTYTHTYMCSYIHMFIYTHTHTYMCSYTCIALGSKYGLTHDEDSALN